MVTTGEASGLRTTQVREYAETYVPEDDTLIRARRTAVEIGLVPVSPGTGAVLRLLAATSGARAVVEIGTGTGVSALWLLRGMRPDGVLTTIDIEPEYQRIARHFLAEAGYTGSRTRLITGRALDVLARLADHAYDLIFLDGERADYAAAAAVAPRLLRAGGVLAVNGALAGGRVADPTIRDPQTAALRDLVDAFRDDPAWRSALLPAGDGLLCAVRA